MKFTQFAVAAMILRLSVTNPTSYYKQLSEEEVARLTAWNPDDSQPMWQLSGQYEGDIVLTPGQRNGFVDTRFRWPNREIPYELSSDFTQQEKQKISESLQREYAKTCIRPRPRKSTDSDYVYVSGNNTGCWSQVGRKGGRQKLNLQRRGCIYHGAIVHEFLHALGFYHQQSATERDDYVDILWENIKKGTEHNFNKYSANVITSFGEKYDYGSVMHYGKYAFTSNGQPTIVPKDPNATIGQNKGLSQTDIVKLNKMYGCA